MQRSDWLAIILAVIPTGIGVYMTTVSRHLARGIGVCLIALGIIGAAVWFGHYKLSADAQQPYAPSSCSNAVGGNNSGNLTNNCPTIINPPAHHNRHKLYLLDGQEEGGVIGIHQSQNLADVTFDQLIVPDDFPWGSPVQLQNAKIVCDKPLGGTMAHIEGMGLPVNKYWSITCKVIGPAG